MLKCSISREQRIRFGTAVGKELLKSVGFEEFASFLEWNDGEDDDGEEEGENRLALVKDAVAALELLKYVKK